MYNLTTERIPTFRIHIDEAGRGPLAGPVFVGLTMSLQQFDTSSFKDSKQLSHIKRKHIYENILIHEQKKEILCACGWVHAHDIDTHGIIRALRTAICRGLFILLKKFFYVYQKEKLLTSVHGEDIIAYHQLQKIFSSSSYSIKKLKDILHIYTSVSEIGSLIIDGNNTFGIDTLLDIHTITIVKGDSKNNLISAASIIAKVERDTYMERIEKQFPQYDFAQHKGYGTKKHRSSLLQLGLSSLHRKSFCHNISTKKESLSNISTPHVYAKSNRLPAHHVGTQQKPGLLLHICCAPDLSRPLHRLKHHFKLYLFWYNPNIHPRPEHDKRYASFIKLLGLEKGDYEIVEDWYDPKEFFTAMVDQREDIDPKLKHATKKAVLAQAGEMEERSSRCNPCYSMRLAEAAKNAEKYGIEYFTSTLLISPKKKMDKLMRRGLEGERRHPKTKFLWFDFAKNKGYEKATKLTKKYGLYRQNYCGCGWTIPKPGQDTSNYVGG